MPRRVILIAAVALAALVAGLVAGAAHVPAEQRLAERFAAAWDRGDYAGMWALLTDDRRRSISASQLAQAYRDSAAVATARSFDVGRPRKDGRDYVLPVIARTASFGSVRGLIRVPIDGDGDDARIVWAPEMTFPGLTAGAQLQRRTSLPPRADLLFRDNTPLAQGAARSSPLPIASSIRGELGPIPADQAQAFRAAGYPDDARVGTSGLEKVFERRLAGTPGGELLAGTRVLARRAPRAAEPVRTTISPRVQEAAVAALAGRLGGVVAMKPESGEITAAAGIAFSGLQPPGSTFKMITVTAALADGVARPSDTFPYATSATVGGVELANANGESCGGTLVQAFAISCNSVFAPLGVKLGARRLVSMAERFGFNAPPTIAGAATSTIPTADEIGDDLAVGSSAIGQGRVQATTLQMARVAATIGLGGRLAEPTLALAKGSPAHVGPRVVRAKVAAQVRRMMVQVVRDGTGVRAAIPGVTVAGKTGTAELRTTQPCSTTEEATNPVECARRKANDPSNTDAWFAAFAPARRPRAVVAVMLVGSGAGGDTAAPAARGVLEAALR